MTLAPASKRPTCSRCLRAHSACICRWIAPTANGVELLVLQHPREASRAKGTARLLCLSLQRSALAVGEAFDPGLLQALLQQPLPGAMDGGVPVRSLLLYPPTPLQQQALGLAAPQAGTAEMRDGTARLRLIVLDGSWRESRKMLYLNPPLQALARLSLVGAPASRYHIRKAHAPDQLSTLEASCAGLAKLEGESAKYLPLLAAFDGFVAQQQTWQSRHP